jgi:putative ABC transport system substrate-binding protein
LRSGGCGRSGFLDRPRAAESGALRHGGTEFSVAAARGRHFQYGHDARPDGNTTGVNVLAGDLDGKRQELLIEAIPDVRRMAALAADANNTAAKLDAMQGAARAHNVELYIYRITRAEEIAAAIDKAQQSGATALNIFAGPLLWAHRQLIIDRAVVLHLPTMHDFPETAEEGGFAAYGPRLGQLFVEVMPEQIVKLFRGSKIADIPVEQATKFELVINLKTAKAMGVTVPEALLVRADKVIE